jgi:hypothetical protein
MKTTALLFSTVAAGLLVAQAQVSQWVAYNDHFRGPQTGPNVSLYNIFANGAPNTGFMLNSADGSTLGVTMSVTNVVAGANGGTTSSGPSAGSPASLLFTNQVDFGNGASNHAIQLAGSSKIVHAFSGLDPSKRYSWHGTAVRANNYMDRWTLLEISAAAWQDAHSTTATGLFTLASSPAIPSLTSSQAVANFGENRLLGTYACWTNIQPNPDGTILIYMSSYHGTMPGTFSSAGTYGYAVVADRLEEFSTGADTCVAFTSDPQDLSVPERGTASFSLTATGTPQTIRWYRSNDGGGSYTQIPGASGPAYGFASAAYPADNGAKFYATVSNSVCQATSAVATLTVVPDTTLPVVVNAIGSSNLVTIVLGFSEALETNSAQETLNYGLNQVGGGTLNVSGAVLTNGTNVILTTDARTPGVNYEVHVEFVQDNASSPNTIVPTNVPLRQQVLIFPFTQVWRYDQSGTDLGTSWKETVFDDSLWPSGPGTLAFENTANTLTFLNTIAPPSGVNTPLVLLNGTGAGINGTNITIYFRTSVNISNFNPASASVTLRAYIDDGGILYVNGTEQWRYNMTNAAGYTNYANAALTEPTPLPQNTYVVTNFAGLVQGENLIAVEIHQNNFSSSDIAWALQLDALVTTFGAPPPRLHVSYDAISGQATISWDGTGTLQEASDVLGGGAGFTDVTPAPTSPHTFTPTGARKFFRLR